MPKRKAVADSDDEFDQLADNRSETSSTGTKPQPKTRIKREVRATILVPAAPFIQSVYLSQAGRNVKVESDYEDRPASDGGEDQAEAPLAKRTKREPAQKKVG